MLGIFIQIAVQNYTIPCISPNFFLSFLILATLTTHLSLCEALYNIIKVYSMLGLDKNQEATFFLLFFEKNMGKIFGSSKNSRTFASAFGKTRWQRRRSLRSLT